MNWLPRLLRGRMAFEKDCPRVICRTPATAICVGEADGKVRQLEQLHPQSPRRTGGLHPPTTNHWAAPLEPVGCRGRLVKAFAGGVGARSSSGILLRLLLRIAVEHAGAERGFVDPVFSGGEPRIGGGKQPPASARLRSRYARRPCHRPSFPESVLHTVIRTRESVILNDALAQNPFSG